MQRRLLDDCFLHDKDRLRHDEALAALKERLSCVVAEEDVALGEARGRIGAAAVTALARVPPSDNSAVDGYAFAHTDYLARKGNMPVSARIAAGHPAGEPLVPGTAARIFTGAVMPAGADTVAMQEDCDVSQDGPHLVVPEGLKPGANRRLAGEDLEAGAVLIEPGQILRAQDIAAAASTGAGHLRCHSPLRVAVFSTGDELVEPGIDLETGQIHDTNRPLLSALLAGLPVTVTDLGILPDDAVAVREALQSASKENDVLLTSGGASRGEEDHLISTLDAIGKRHTWQLAIKPGRPMCFGQIGNTVVLGLPGNPVAVFVCFLLYARPALLMLGGAGWREPKRFLLKAGFEIARKKPDRREFLRGILEPGTPSVSVNKFPRDGSGLISSLREAHGLVEIPEEATSVATGDMVAFLPFDQFGI